MSIDDQMVSVTGPRVGITVYRLWISLQAIFLALTVPLLVSAIVFWDWKLLVAAVVMLFLYWVISSVGAVALWEFQTLMSFERGGYLNKASEGCAVSFEAPDGETGNDAVYVFYTSINDDPKILARLLEGK